MNIVQHPCMLIGRHARVQGTRVIGGTEYAEIGGEIIGYDARGEDLAYPAKPSLCLIMRFCVGNCHMHEIVRWNDNVVILENGQQYPFRTIH